MHVVCVTFPITVGKIEEFLPKMHLQARNSIEREPDCYRFDVCQSNTNDHEVFPYEVYTDEAAFENISTVPSSKNLTASRQLLSEINR